MAFSLPYNPIKKPFYNPFGGVGGAFQSVFSALASPFRQRSAPQISPVDNSRPFGPLPSTAPVGAIPAPTNAQSALLPGGAPSGTQYNAPTGAFGAGGVSPLGNQQQASF